MKGMLQFIAEIGQSLKAEFGKHADSELDFELKVKNSFFYRSEIKVHSNFVSGSVWKIQFRLPCIVCFWNQPKKF